MRNELVDQIIDETRALVIAVDEFSLEEIPSNDRAFRLVDVDANILVAVFVDDNDVIFRKRAIFADVLRRDDDARPSGRRVVVDDPAKLLPEPAQIAPFCQITTEVGRELDAERRLRRQNRLFGRAGRIVGHWNDSVAIAGNLKKLRVQFDQFDQIFEAVLHWGGSFWKNRENKEAGQAAREERRGVAKSNIYIFVLKSKKKSRIFQKIAKKNDTPSPKRWNNKDNGSKETARNR